MKACHVSGEVCSGQGAQLRARRRVDMTEPGAVLKAVDEVLADLAVVLTTVRSGLGAECARAGRHLEMGEMDLLAARDAVEKACWEIGPDELSATGIGIVVPPSVGSIRQRIPVSDIPVTPDAAVESRVPRRRRVGMRNRALPGPDQEGLFSVEDVTSRALHLR